MGSQCRFLLLLLLMLLLLVVVVVVVVVVFLCVCVCVFFQVRCWVVVVGCQENESCSKVLNFLERLDDRIRFTHEERVAVVKPWEDIGSNKSLDCVFSEKPADWTKAFKLEISSLTDFMTYFFVEIWVKNESKVPGRIREGDVVRAKSNRIREGNVGRFQGGRRGKRRASVLSSFSLSWLSIIHVFMLSVHALSSLVRLVTSLRRADFYHWRELPQVPFLFVATKMILVASPANDTFWSCVSSAKSWWFTEWLVMVSERGVVYRMNRTGPSTETWGIPYMSCNGDEDELLTKMDWYLSERYD